MKRSKRLIALIDEAKLLAQEYHELTGRPLGITGEVAEYEAARVLDLELAPVRQDGYDAVRASSGGVTRLQVKGRRMDSAGKPSGRLGALNPKKKWDAVLLVLLHADFELATIWEADRDVVIEALVAPGSRARNERGQLSVRQFCSIARKVWPLAEVS